MAGEGRLPIAALAFAVAAALSSWNPLSAPFGVVVGLGALALALRARRRARRLGWISAAVLAGLAVVASALVLALTAGVGRELRGTAVVAPPPREEVQGELDAAAERTRAARERARAELETLQGGKDSGKGRQPGGQAPATPQKPR